MVGWRRHTGGIGRRKGGKRGLPAQLTAGIAGFCYRFSPFDSFPESPDDGGPPHAARPPRRLDRARDRGCPDRGAHRAHRDRHPPHRDAARSGPGRAGTQRKGPRPADREPPVRPGGGTAPSERGGPHARGRPGPARSLASIPSNAISRTSPARSARPRRRRNCPASRRSLRPHLLRRASCRCAQIRCAAPRAAAQPESRCGGPSRDQQPDRRRIGRHQDRVRRRSRRQRHDRRTAHHVVEPEGDPARDAGRAPPRDRDPRGREARLDGASPRRRPARQCQHRGAPVRGARRRRAILPADRVRRQRLALQ